MSSNKSEMCDKIEKLCDNCSAVFHCSKKYEEENLSRHKALCKPFKIEVSDKIGRFMVSTRDIKPGEIILKEFPTVIGPRIDSRLICFGCHRILINDNYKLCSKCSLAPLCSPECELKSFHVDRECFYYQERLRNITGEFLSSNLQLITPLRCLMLKNTENKNLWDEFINLESHLNEKLNSSIWHFYQEKIFNVLKSKIALEEEDEILIQKICAILDINSFELRGPQWSGSQSEILRGIYLKAALMSHDCIFKNTFLSVDDNFEMTIRASVFIKAGEPVLFNYANPFETTLNRQQRLKEGKHFICTCKRCSDPTELGTYMGSIICSKCFNGFVIPFKPLSEQTDWFCNVCNHKFHERLIKATINEGFTLIERMETADYKKLESLLKKLLKTFPEKGVVVIELKQKLIACLRDVILREPNSNRNILKLKMNLCQELLDVLNIIEPGLSRLKGIILYELYKPKVILAHKDFDIGKISSSEFLSALNECEKILKEALSFLIYEPQLTPEGRLNQIALSELKILREDINNVTISH